MKSKKSRFRHYKNFDIFSKIQLLFLFNGLYYNSNQKQKELLKMQKEIQNLIDNPAMIREALNTDQLDRLIRKVAMVHGQTITMKYEVKACQNGDARLDFHCEENLANACGIFANILTDCRLNTFSNGIEFTEAEGLTAWFELHLSYRHFQGNSNGMVLARFAFANGKWEICDCKDMR